MKYERMSVAFAIHNSDLEEGSFRGMASVFNNLIDTWVPTRILPGAFSKTLQENSKRIKVLYQHNPDWPIGKPTKMEENSDGLLVEAKISQTTQGKDILTLIRDEVLTELSIGFDPIRHILQEESLEGMKVQVRHIQECRLWEFSPVTFAANSRATISSVNSLFSALRSDSDLELAPDVHAFVKTIFDSLRGTQSAPTTAEEFWSLVTRTVAERHAGKVLSAKNKELVANALNALQALIDAAEPKSDDEESRRIASLTAFNTRMRDLDLNALNLI